MLRKARILKVSLAFALSYVAYQYLIFDILENRKSDSLVKKETSKHQGTLRSTSSDARLNQDKLLKKRPTKVAEHADKATRKLEVVQDTDDKRLEEKKENNSAARVKTWLDEIPQKPSTYLEVVYTSLDKCSKPEYLPEYNALCVRGGRADSEVKCLPNFYLLGIRKCGTNDVNKWFQFNNNRTKVLRGGDVIKSNCPMDYFRNKYVYALPKDFDLFNYSPGEIMFSSIKKRNLTHLVIGTTLQYVAFLSHPTKSKYMLTLRNPTQRLLSCIFHSHVLGYIYHRVRSEQFDGKYVHNLVVDMVKDLKSCIGMYGELACVFMFDSKDGNLKSMVQHGMYVIYITEVYKFIPKESVYINHLEEYSANQLKHAFRIMEFFGQHLDVADSEIIIAGNKQFNTNKKPEILPETIELLDDFYRPYNIRLAKLLNDDKWLYN